MKTLIDNSKSVDSIDLEIKVKNMYKKVAEQPTEKYHFEMGRHLAEKLGYNPFILDEIPEESIQSFAGVGYYFDFANLKKGEFVVDLGSGSGMDAFYAAQLVGKNGHVLGIDMTPEQLMKSKHIQKEFGFNNVAFKEAYIENTTVASSSFDVVISNGVINLSRAKEAVFNEISRILKPGGRMVISDIVAAKSFPAEITCHSDLWAACVAGAMQIDIYLDTIKNAGLEIIKVKENPYSFISDMAKGATKNYGISSISLLAIKK